MAPRKLKPEMVSRGPVTRSVSRKEKKAVDTVSKSRKVGKKQKIQTDGRKSSLKSAGKKPKDQIASKKSKSKAVGRKPKSAKKQPETRTTDEEPDSTTTDDGPDSPTTDEGPETPTASKIVGEEPKTQTPDRKRKANEDSSDQGRLVALEPSPKKPRIFLRLRFGKQVVHPSQRASEIIAAMYWDINYLCLKQGLMWKSNDMENVTFYESQHNEARKVIRMAVDFELNLLSPAEKHVHEARNIARFVHNFGWRTLTICAWSEAFRRACLQETDREVWNKLIKLIRNNSDSLINFARLRNLDWRGLLIRYSNHPIPKIKRDLKWVYKRIGNEHPHLFARTGTDGLRKLTYKGRPLENLEECEFNPTAWVAEGQRLEDPRTRKERHGACAFCASSEPCRCTMDSLAAGLVELVDYPVKGVGVRALTNFKKGDLLGEYVGELRRPRCDDDDDVYALYLQARDDREDVVLASISAQYKGNWTRFINHSCNASTAFVSRTIGNHLRMTVEAVRDIPMFEEITIGYGEWYWKDKDRRCQCGEPNCLSLKEMTRGSHKHSTSGSEGTERGEVRMEEGKA